MTKTFITNVCAHYIQDHHHCLHSSPCLCTLYTRPSSTTCHHHSIHHLKQAHSHHHCLCTLYTRPSSLIAFITMFVHTIYKTIIDDDSSPLDPSPEAGS